MSDRERLEEINNFSSLPLKKRISLTKESIKKELKANDYHMPKNININTQYLLEIIEQAERVEELEKQRNERTQLLNAEVKERAEWEIEARTQYAINKRLKKEIKQYRQALRDIRNTDTTKEVYRLWAEQALKGEYRK